MDPREQYTCSVLITFKVSSYKVGLKGSLPPREMTQCYLIWWIATYVINPIMNNSEQRQKLNLLIIYKASESLSKHNKKRSFCLSGRELDLFNKTQNMFSCCREFFFTSCHVSCCFHVNGTNGRRGRTKRSGLGLSEASRKRADGSRGGSEELLDEALHCATHLNQRPRNRWGVRRSTALIKGDTSHIHKHQTGH